MTAARVCVRPIPTEFCAAKRSATPNAVRRASCVSRTESCATRIASAALAPATKLGPPISSGPFRSAASARAKGVDPDLGSLASALHSTLRVRTPPTVARSCACPTTPMANAAFAAPTSAFPSAEPVRRPRTAAARSNAFRTDSEASTAGSSYRPRDRTGPARPSSRGAHPIDRSTPERVKTVGSRG